MPIIITAHDGDKLREYAKLYRNNKNVLTFPEYGLSANEQANIVKSVGNDHEKIITFSSFIISDAEEGKLIIIDNDEHQCPINHGDSINKITMALGRKETIGNMALSKLKAAREQVETASTKEDILNIITHISRDIGDSIEKMLFIKTAYSKIDNLLICDKCKGDNYLPINCCSGAECGCMGQIIDYKPCDKCNKNESKKPSEALILSNLFFFELS
jgi:hypothetical protein